MTRRYFQIFEWVVVTLVVTLAIVAWVTQRIHPGMNITIYQIFPLFGILAFSLMWAHFITRAVRMAAGLKPVSDAYIHISMGLVFSLILLHPGLLWYQLWADGFGLPPVSYLTAYSSQMLFTLLGTFGLFVFLSYELKRWFRHKSWWKWVRWIQIPGMVAIYFHAIELGGELALPWYRTVWYVYGVVFVMAAGYTYWSIWNRKKREEHGNLG